MSSGVRIRHVATCPVSRLYGQLKPGLINASPLVGSYPALLETRRYHSKVHGNLADAIVHRRKAGLSHPSELKLEKSDHFRDRAWEEF